ncbi:hypothetical protein Rsub_03176 [Raphidocelis subcapitata]|uniref:DUF155 domain-containing protein n=1 Tax=Raphidocelis subcapitata TaxID=307507 RepID=A0A2V0NSJ8_9CHLO|nr:hypothetical protein Rsub_03176 [Raphidocelis subcapitata]|eukprot:GBF90604.1 hypothetical protein Rsub_03176 [Raphidocelis subcapitata]
MGRGRLARSLQHALTLEGRAAAGQPALIEAGAATAAAASPQQRALCPLPSARPRLLAPAGAAARAPSWPTHGSCQRPPAWWGLAAPRSSTTAAAPPGVPAPQQQQQQQHQHQQPDGPVQAGADQAAWRAARVARLQRVAGCDPAAAEALARDHPTLLLLGPYVLRRLARPSLGSDFPGGGEAGLTGGHKAGAAGAGSPVLFKAAVDAPAVLQMRAMTWGMRIHIGQLAEHCRTHLGLPVDAGRDFAIVWLGPRLQPRVVRRASPAAAAAAGPPQPPPGAQARAAAGAAPREPPPPPSPPVRRRRDARAPFALLAYRHGAVVLLGPPALALSTDTEFEMPDADAALLSRVMPLGVFYRTGLPEGSAETGPSLAQPAAADVQTIEIEPAAAAAARKEPDRLVLRTLDVGHLCVASSILGQSVALSQVDKEVDAALAALHAAMAKVPPSRVTGTFASAQDNRLFKAAAYGSLAITDAHSLLAAGGELSWRYDAFSAAWTLLAEDFDLAPRFRALQLKLDEIKHTAAFDLKHRGVRRYAKLTDRVILLLVISCVVAFVEMLLPPNADHHGGGARGKLGIGGGGGGGGGGGADREWRWDGGGGGGEGRWWRRLPLGARRSAGEGEGAPADAGAVAEAVAAGGDAEALPEPAAASDGRPEVRALPDGELIISDAEAGDGDEPPPWPQQQGAPAGGDEPPAGGPGRWWRRSAQRPQPPRDS